MAPAMTAQSPMLPRKVRAAKIPMVQPSKRATEMARLILRRAERAAASSSMFWGVSWDEGLRGLWVKGLRVQGVKRGRGHRCKCRVNQFLQMHPARLELATLGSEGKKRAVCYN